MKKQMDCPICGRRLFDVKDGTTGKVSIKCSKCKQVVEISLGKNTPRPINKVFRTEPQGV